MRFTIWTPLPETAPHAGVRVLWRLGRELTTRGHHVTMWTRGEPQPDADVLILPERTAPETSHPRTVRWVLLHGGQRRPTDRLYTWSPAYADAPLLNVPYFDLEDFPPTDQPRHGTAIWVGKGTPNTPIPADARPITYRLPRAEVLHILATSVTLLSFDPFSAVNTEATLLGTPVHIPQPRPPEMPAGDNPGIRWADVDNTATLNEARDHVRTANVAAHATVDAFEKDMLA